MGRGGHRDLARTESTERFQLEVRVTDDAGTTKFASVGKGVVGAIRKDSPEARALPRYGRPRRRNDPLFHVPSELRLSGTPRTWLTNCVAPGGEIVSSGMPSPGTRPLHPRLMGAVLDWLRRFEYETPGWDPRVRAVCEQIEIHFDQPPSPPPKQTGSLEATFN